MTLNSLIFLLQAPASKVLEIEACATKSGFMCYLELNPELHACQASILSAELHPKPSGPFLFAETYLESHMLPALAGLLLHTQYPHGFFSPGLPMARVSGAGCRQER